MNTSMNIQVLPTLPLRGLTIFPGIVLHFDVARTISIKAVEEALATGQELFLVSQRNSALEQPELEDLYPMGTVATVRQVLRLPGDTARVMVEGLYRGRIHELMQKTPFLSAQVEVYDTPPAVKQSAKSEALVRMSYQLLEEYTALSPKLNKDTLRHIVTRHDPGYIADYIAQNIPLRGADKQALLAQLNPIRRLMQVNQVMKREIEILAIEQDLEEKMQNQVAKSQKDFILREQMQVLRRELGDDGDSELELYRARIKKARLPKTVEEKLLQDLGRLAKQPFGSAEGAVLRGYLDTCLELPWTKKTRERSDVSLTRKILDADHYGLDEVKERILEFIAVRQRAPELKSPILCFIGPPGVGKTSVAISIARATNRKLARLSLGGVRDEAEIRGHRRTYVGAMPGRIISAIRQCGSSNPLLLLDEIDKLGNDFRGDPASALLEVLDPEQNHAFRDHFLELPFDLSQVFFITTANDASTIPRPLLDRMEVIELSSYTDEEKLQIAKRHLLPKQLKQHGLKKSMLKISDDTLRELIVRYTRESGVRKLERELASLCRKTAMQLVSGEQKSVAVTVDSLEQLLGPRKFYPEKLATTGQVGLVNGLAWTSTGGEVLEVEVAVVPGSGKIELTGNLGDVMKESAHAAHTFIRSRTQQLGIEKDFYEKKDIHVHFPEGAVPKDGPSAGIAITTAMVSALTGRAVHPGYAMTGEVTLRGRVLPIGGLKEKTMAAFRNGIHTVLIPAENESDLAKIDPTVRNALHFITVEHVDAVIDEALETAEGAAPILVPQQTSAGVGVELQ
ncbi:MAG: endopeptidase La [Oscillospiraceae bacterium]|nr:endopeptidase La [Oscillospiraceae bacterium]